MGMVTEKSWEEFRETKLLWWVNRTLHLFGWAIVVEVEDKTEKVTRAYPARVKFRGFDTTTEEEGFVGLSWYLANQISELLHEVTESEDVE